MFWNFKVGFFADFDLFNFKKLKFRKHNFLTEMRSVSTKTIGQSKLRTRTNEFTKVALINAAKLWSWD